MRHTDIASFSNLVVFERIKLILDIDCSLFDDRECRGRSRGSARNWRGSDGYSNALAFGNGKHIFFWAEQAAWMVLERL